VTAASGVRFGFRSEHRLHETEEFSSTLASRRVLRGSCFDLHYRLGSGSGARLGLIIGKKFASRAVQRNLLKRLAREAFRQARPVLANYDLVLRLARAPGNSASKEARDAWRVELEGLLARLPQ
jgi:ribonuclease P protein component